MLNTYAFELAGDGKRVTGARIWSNGKDAGIYATDYYVPCTGGLENSRLLLWSNQRSNGAVVPHAAALGRYWMEHPQFLGGNAILADYNAFEVDGVNEAFFSPSPAAMEARQIMNFGVRLIETPYGGVKQLIADLACTAPDLAEWTSIQLGQDLRCAAQLYVGWEQAPLASNHIRLSASERDGAGVPRIELHWKKSDLERRTIIEGLRLFGETLAAKDIGRVRIADWLVNGEDYPTDQELAGHHHMGGTRMSDDVTKGVVDRNCKVHGMDNLYIGGSSVFATSGQCNPTTTITALACRLGDHLGGIAVSAGGTGPGPLQRRRIERRRILPAVDDRRRGPRSRMRRAARRTTAARNRRAGTCRSRSRCASPSRGRRAHGAPRPSTAWVSSVKDDISPAPKAFSGRPGSSISPYSAVYQ